MEITWTIVELFRETDTGLVVRATWRADAVDGDYSAITGGSVLFEREETFIPYEELTQEQVIGWVKDKLDINDIEANLQSQIDSQKIPPIASGLPWTVISG